MRYTINQIREGEDELILNYRQLNPEVEKVIAFMDQNQKKMIGRVDGETILFSPEEILHMAEMIFLTYIVGYIQVFLLWNFDEADCLGKKEVLGIGICTVIYTGISYLCNWFDRNCYVTIGFAFYVIFLYVCVYFVYKCRRKIDDKILNSDLELFQARSGKEK